ncbi:uncharacterized protein LOC110716485 [Chenopodium quinoa]|uniref:uncharacterized protein LOC110716485 n=1 Tax=Chenopodium quinoa TaxID=63459 RepID=UPI000B777909|nr:uncharacterized protein LOC110716485 [Chenopodium quinoa]
MAARFGSLSRSFMSSARTSTLRSPPSLLRPPPISSPRLRPRRPSFAPSRNFGELGCTQSLLPFSCAATLPGRLSTELRVSELFHGNNGEDG